MIKLKLSCLKNLVRIRCVCFIIDITESFNLIDIDGDGLISVHELMSIMGSVGEDLSNEDVLVMKDRINGILALEN